MKKITAEKIASVVRSNADSLTSLLPCLETELADDEFQFYKREIARVLTVMDSGLIQQLLIEHPEIDPWKGESNG